LTERKRVREKVREREREREGVRAREEQVHVGTAD